MQNVSLNYFKRMASGQEVLVRTICYDGFLPDSFIMTLQLCCFGILFIIQSVIHYLLIYYFTQSNVSANLLLFVHLQTWIFVVLSYFNAIKI